MHPRNCIVEEQLHGRILRRIEKKTDSPRGPGVLLPGSCNQLARALAREEEKERVPDTGRRRSQIELRVRIWGGDLILRKR
jgi:hypothetical protein